MIMLRTHVLALAILTAALMLPGSAQAVLKENGRFVFEPYTKNNDPVNILLFGGKFNKCDGGRRDPGCFAAIVSLTWRANGDMDTRFCNGRDGLTFRRGRERPVRRNDTSTSTSTTCRRQYHARYWGDSLINVNREWSVGVVYRETRGTFQGGHDINQAWESSEEILAFEARTQSAGEIRQCKVDDWRPVAGQRPGRHRGWINNGRITRISSQAYDNERGCKDA